MNYSQYWIPVTKLLYYTVIQIIIWTGVCITTEFIWRTEVRMIIPQRLNTFFLPAMTTSSFLAISRRWKQQQGRRREKEMALSKAIIHSTWTEWILHYIICYRIFYMNFINFRKKKWNKNYLPTPQQNTTARQKSTCLAAVFYLLDLSQTTEVCLYWF